LLNFFFIGSLYCFLVLLLLSFVSLLILVRFVRGLSILYIFWKNNLFCFVDFFCLFFLVSYFIDSSNYFYYFLPCTCFEFSLLFFF
jgi:hypothetical protein